MAGPLGRKYETAKERDNRRIQNVFSDFICYEVEKDERIDGDELWARISFYHHYENMQVNGDTHGVKWMSVENDGLVETVFFTLYILMFCSVSLED